MYIRFNPVLISLGLSTCWHVNPKGQKGQHNTLDDFWACIQSIQGWVYLPTEYWIMRRKSSINHWRFLSKEDDIDLGRRWTSFEDFGDMTNLLINDAIKESGEDLPMIIQEWRQGRRKKGKGSCHHSIIEGDKILKRRRKISPLWSPCIYHLPLKLHRCSHTLRSFLVILG